MLGNYLKVAIRNIVRHKSYSLINVAGLAVGLACVIFIFLWVQNQRSYDKFHENADRLCRVAFTTEKEDFHGYYIPGLLAPYLKEHYPEIVEAANYRDYWGEAKIAYGETSFMKSGAFVDPSFLEMFSFPFIEGDPKTAFTEPLSVVITQSLAHAIFGDEDPIGQALTLDDQVGIPITGVIKDIPANSHIQFDFLLSFAVAPDWMKTWDNKTVRGYVLLDGQSTVEQVSAKIIDVYNEHNPGDTKNNLYLQPVTETYLYNVESQNNGEQKIITYVYILSIIAAAILLIACINFMNLSTARSTVRAREIGIRKAVGSSRLQLTGQFLSESIIMSLAALAAAVLIVELLLPSFNNILGVQLKLSYTWGTILPLMAVGIITGLLAGCYPAFLLSSFSATTVLQRPLLLLPTLKRSRLGRSEPRARNFSFRKILVVFQFALSIILIVAVMVLGNQLDYIRTVDLGYDQQEIVVLELHGNLTRNVNTVKSELLKNPSIKSISLTLSQQIKWSESCGLDWEGMQPGDAFDTGINRVDYDYIKTFGMEMAAGRFYSEEFPSDYTDALVVNEAAVRAMGITDPIGKTIGIPALERESTIIGVVKDFHSESLHKEVRPFALVPSRFFRYMNIRISGDNPQQTLGFIERTIRGIVPDDPFVYSFLNDDLNRLYQAEQRTGEVVRYMTYLAIFISCLGLFGLASFSIERRTREIAVRKIHGASVGRLVKLITSEFVILVGLACIVAWPAAWYVMTRWLNNFAFRTGVTWDIFVLSGGLALAVVIATISIRAIRAALANPVNSLRHE